nr:16018_t:CDS:2 [Entrophospora candida]
MTKLNNAQATTIIRQEIDIPNLTSYLASRIPEIKLPIETQQFKFGQSNPTYLLIDANQKRYVLRKKPPGKLLSTTAHAVEREFHILDALGKYTDVPVPKVYLLCKDNEIIGTPFYVMEFLNGRIFEDVRLLSLSPNERKNCWFSLVNTLAKLHSVDYKAIGLGDYGKSSEFYSRQVRSLLKVSKAQAAVVDEDGNEVGALPGLDEMIKWFKNNEIPDEATILHGDFKVFHPTESHVIGILDWELSTIGHPLSDLANLLMQFYVSENAVKPLIGLKDVPNLLIPSADELIYEYCIKTKRKFPIPNFEYAIVFSFFRLAVITQGIAARIAHKQASSSEAQNYARMFKPIKINY